MLKLSNFLKIDNFQIFKDKCLSFNDPKIISFINVIEDTISLNTINIDEQVRKIYGYIVSDFVLLDFLIENVFEYNENEIESLREFMLQSPDSQDKTIIFNKLVEEGIESMNESMNQVNTETYENILSKLDDISYDSPYELPDNIVINDVIYMTEGDFLLCYIKDKGFNFEKINVDSYNNIEELIDTNRTPVIDIDFTNEMFRQFTFDVNENWEEDLFSIIENHYNELGEAYEHTSIYGDTNFTVDNNQTILNFAEVIYSLYFYGRMLADNVWSDWMSEEGNERYMSGTYNEEEAAFVENYPVEVDLQEEADSLLIQFNAIKNKYPNLKIQFNKIENKYKYLNEDLSLQEIKEKFITCLNNLDSLIDYQELVVEDENYPGEVYESILNWSRSHNENVGVWIDSYLTLS